MPALIEKKSTKCMEPKSLPFVLIPRRAAKSSATAGESQVGQVFFGVPVQPPTRNLSEFRSETPDEANGEWQRRRDEEIRLAVMTALHWDLAVPRNSVEVTVKGGWVTLTGQVRRAYEKSCAEADARMTSGVIGVTNEIDCKPAK